MGSPIGTSTLVGISTAGLIVMAILIIIADDRLRGIIGFNTNDKLKNAHNQLITAQILAWIAAGLGVLLLIGYLFLHGGFLQNEWIHLILWVLLFVGLIISGVFLIIAITEIDNANINNDNTSKGYIWGALIAGIAALVVLIISGGWRIVHKTYYETPGEEGQLYADALPADGAPMEPGEIPLSGQTQPQVQVTTTPGVV